jgi:hypothetical protein
MEIMKNVEVGTKVKVGIVGGTYSTYRNFFKEAGVSELEITFAENETAEVGSVGTVMAVAKHSVLDRDIAIIDVKGKTYVMEVNSFVPENVELTEEIIAELDKYANNQSEEDFGNTISGDPFIRFLFELMKGEVK